MKNRLSRFLGLFLCVLMITTCFSGCAQKQGEEQAVEGKSDNLEFNPTGKYTVTLTLDNAEFSEDLKAEDLKVMYYTVAEPSKDNPEFEIKEMYASVDGFNRKDEKSVEISFTDKDAAKYLANQYTVVVDKAKTGIGKYVVGCPQVKYDDNTVTADIDIIPVFDKDLKITFSLNEGEFEKVDEKKIKLDGCIKNMKIADITATGKNMTVLLTGTPEKNKEMGIYENGIFEIDMTAFKNGYKNRRVLISAGTTAYGTDAEKFEFKDGKASVLLNVNGFSFAENVSAKDFKADGITFVDFKKESTNSGILTFTVEGAKDKNSAAALADGKIVNVAAKAVNSGKEIPFEINLNSASFYPVFDYAEEKDGTYTITLILYSRFGFFSEKFDKDMIKFADDFKDGKIVSLKKNNENVCELVFTLPSSGIPVENMKLSGNVVLKAGSLVNLWGDGREGDADYVREYTGTNMGKALDADDIEMLNEMLGTFANTDLGALFSGIEGIAAAGEAGVALLEIAGVIESEKAKLDKIYAAIEGITDSLQNIQLKITENAGKELSNRVSDFFNNKLLQLEKYYKYAGDLIEDAKAELKDKGTVQPADKKDSKALDEYMKAVMHRATEMDNEDIFSHLLNYYGLVQASIVTYGGLENIISDYDQYLTYHYNFDTETYIDKEAFRTLLKTDLSLASTRLCSYYRYGKERPSQNRIDNISEQYNKAKTKISQCTYKKRSENAYMFVKGLTVREACWCKHMPGFLPFIEMTDAEAENFVRRLNGKKLIDVIESLKINFGYKGNSIQLYEGSSFADAKNSYLGNGFAYNFDIKSSGNGVTGKNKRRTYAHLIDDNTEGAMIHKDVLVEERIGGWWWKTEYTKDEPMLFLVYDLDL